MRRCLWGLSLGLALQACVVPQEHLAADPPPSRAPFLPFGADRLEPMPAPTPGTAPTATTDSTVSFLKPPMPAIFAARVVEVPARVTTGSTATAISHASRSAAAVLAEVLRDSRNQAAVPTAEMIPRAIVADSAVNETKIPVPTVTPPVSESLADAVQDSATDRTVLPDYDPPAPRRTYRTPERPAGQASSAQSLIFERARFRAQQRLARLESTKWRGQSIARPQLGPPAYDHAFINPYPWYAGPYWKRAVPR